LNLFWGSRESSILVFGLLCLGRCNFLMSQEQKNSKASEAACSSDDERMSGSSDENGPGGLELEAFDGSGMDSYTRYDELIRLQSEEAKINQRLIYLEQELHKYGRLITHLWEHYRTSQPSVQLLLKQTIDQHSYHGRQHEREQIELLKKQDATRKKINTFCVSSSSSITSTFSNLCVLPPISVPSSTPIQIESTTFSPSSTVSISSHYTSPLSPTITLSSQSQSFLITTTSSTTPPTIASTSLPSRPKDSRVHSGTLNGPDYSVASTESVGSRSVSPQDSGRHSVIGSRPSSRGSPSKPE